MSYSLRSLLGQQPLWLVSAILTCTLSGQPADAQLVPDTTLGNHPSIVNRMGLQDTISGGLRSGNNLFHSFREFNVDLGRSVYFTDPGVANILTRVTGNNPSNINGRLGVNGNANLFLINPNGILFGAGASLDIRGSFTATTANAVKFSDGSEFSATNPAAPNLLTISVPLGLQWGTNPAAAAIVNRGQLQTGQNLTLNASQLDLQGSLQAGGDLNLLAKDTVQIRDTLTEPFLAQAGGDLTIQGDRGIDILALNHPQTPFVSGKNLTLISDGAISGDAHFASGGIVSLLNLAGQPGSFTSLYDPIIRANGDVLFGNYTGVSLKVEATGSIQGGNIRITGPDTTIPTSDPDFAVLTGERAVILRAGVPSVAIANLPLTTGGTTFNAGIAAPGQLIGSIVVGNIDTSNSTGGNGGSIQLSATGNIITNRLESYTFANVGNAGSGGQISLNSLSGNLTINGDVRSFSAANSGPVGNGGAIRLSSNLGNITTNGALDAFSYSRLGSTGFGGTILLSAPNGQVTSDTSTRINSFSVSEQATSGNGGAVTIAARNQISRFEILTVASSGSAGTVQINGLGDLSIQDSRVIASESLPIQFCSNCGITTLQVGNQSSTGDITVNSLGNLSFFNSQINGETKGLNSAGNVTIASGGWLTLNSSQIRNNTSSLGSAGNITLIANQGITLTGQGSRVSAETGSQGNAGNVVITTPQLSVNQNTQIATTTTGPGRAGNIQVQTAETTISGNGSGIISGSGTPIERGGNKGDGGSVRITTGILRIFNSGTVSTSTFAQGQSGSIDVVADSVELTNGGKLSATTQDQGNAGNIQVTARDRLLISGAPSGLFVVTTREASGNGGNVSVTTPTLEILDGGRINAASQGRGRGGDVEVSADNITLNNKGGIFAETASSDGGNINLNVRDVLLLRHNALISASAGTAQAGGNGGNITINAGFVVGVLQENSDISANAFTGNGGQVNISAQGIYGLQFQPQSTPLSDITASSQFGLNGTVTINTLQFDPNRGLVQLPNDFVNPNPVAQTCSPQQQGGSFTITGRGGVSPDPNEALNQTEVWLGDSQTANARSAPSAGDSQTRSNLNRSAPLIEATQWQRNSDGSISLVADGSEPIAAIATYACQTHAALEEH